MKVILKQDVEKLGRRGDVVNVAPGFGRNYLIPRKMAMAVTATNMKAVEIERQAQKKKLEAERKAFQSLVEKLNQVTLTFARRAGEKDVIFGSVSSGDIRDALAGLGHDIDRRKILLDEPIKRLGNFTVPVKISLDDRAEVKIVVAREGAEEEGAGAAGPPAEAPESGKS
ncbi:MAG TPA: 50S ribosomal protein L9 [Candidatus Aminicenantes bacterium]|nr:50S ribosomal protein L9 [Candidatus Aminicenantes bacterium]